MRKKAHLVITRFDTALKILMDEIKHKGSPIEIAFFYGIVMPAGNPLPFVELKPHNECVNKVNTSVGQGNNLALDYIYFW